MVVEVWSDIMCPFCYIGKRHFEAALALFAQKDAISIEWKSFQLDPSIPDNIEKPTHVYAYLAQRKGISVEQSKMMHDNVTQMALQAGLNYNFDKVIIANSFKAHRILQLAKSKGLDDALEELLFKAYFIDGKNLADNSTLIQLATSIGLSEAAIHTALSSDENAYLVNQDIREAQQLGVNGVPFFVFNRQYAVSGAQPVEVFLQTLEKSYNTWENDNSKNELQQNEGASCQPNKDCN